MDFQPGDVQWLLNYAALHSRTGYVDCPSRSAAGTCCACGSRDVGRPLVEGFGKNVVKGRDEARGGDDSAVSSRVKHIAEAVVPDLDWGK